MKVADGAVFRRRLAQRTREPDGRILLIRRVDAFEIDTRTDFIWRTLAKRLTLRELTMEFARHFGMSFVECEALVLATLLQLEALELVER